MRHSDWNTLSPELENIYETRTAFYRMEVNSFTRDTTLAMWRWRVLYVTKNSISGQFRRFSTTTGDSALQRSCQLVITVDNGWTVLSTEIPVTSSNDVSSHNVSITMTTTQIHMTLWSRQLHHGKCMSCDTRPSVIGKLWNLNLWIGVGRMTPYIRSKLLTVKGFTGCLGESQVFPMF